eukprot:SAG11_NODE_814_length_7033_cov_57.557254_8_plen_54_part_00
MLEEARRNDQALYAEELQMQADLIRQSPTIHAPLRRHRRAPHRRHSRTAPLAP